MTTIIRSSRYFIFLLTLLFIMRAGEEASASETANDLIKRVSTKISNGGGIKASFKMTGGAKADGTIYYQGNKFSVVSSNVSTWYDGKSLWTYNPSTNETTLVTPTATEILESNPLAYIGSYSQFTAVYETGGLKGTKIIRLVPKSKKSGVKSVKVTVNTTSLIPSKIIVLPSSGREIVITVTALSVGNKFNSSIFSYPKSKYPKVKVIDLR